MARTPVIVAPHQVTRQNAGDKAMRLTTLGAEQVPKWFAISPQAIREILQHSGYAGSVAAELDRIRQDRFMLEDVSRKTQQMVASSKVPLELKYEISEAMKRYLTGEGTFAVRSSVVDPESAKQSGLNDSFLYLRDEEDVCRAMLRVWASAYSERALTHRLTRGVDPEQATMAVIVQDMVEVRSSGIMHTINLEVGDLREMHLRSLWGTGEGIAAGLAVDSFRVPKNGDDPIAGVGTKSQEMVMNPDTGSGLKRSAVPETRQNMRSLSSGEVAHLFDAGLRIEKAAGRTAGS